MGRHHLLTLLPVLLLGCGTDVQRRNDTGASRSDGVEQALSDGKVTFSEYETAFLSFQDCMLSRGAELTNVELNPTIQLYTFEVQESAVTSGVEDECYIPHFAAIDQAWQLSADRPKPGYESMSVVDVLTECLESNGATVGADITVDDLVLMLPGYGQTMDSCVQLAQSNHP